MTQSRSADAVPAEAGAARRATGPAPGPRHRRMAWQLIVLAAIPAVLVLAVTGLRVTDATRSAAAYGQTGRLAALGQQVTGLAQAMADERSGTAAFIARGRPAAGLPALRGQYAITDGRAATVRRLISRLGTGYPARTRAAAAQVLASIAKLPGLRRQAAQGNVSALAVITGYSAATAGLFPVSDGIAGPSGNSTLISSARALGSLSRMSDHASQQQAILDVALAGGRFGPGALTALTAARARQASDLASFGDSATAEESWALTQTLARPPARQAQAVEQRAMAAGNGVLALGPRAGQQWSAGMSYTVGWMDHAEQQLAGWITADAQALQRSAMRSAMITGGVGLGALALVLLGTWFAVRTVVRRLSGHRAATSEHAGARLALEGAQARLAVDDAGARPALEGAEARLPGSASAISTGFLWRNHSLLERLLRLIDSSELNEDDPERLANLFEMDHLATRVWRNSDSALALTGHETARSAEPLALVDVLRAAASEIEEYGRVILDAQPGVRVSGSAATDTVHLLAELLENATTFSPETSQVIVSGHAVIGGGALITITDGGTGMSEEELSLLNWQLANPSPEDMAAGPRLGLHAVALLAAPHGITVTLSTPPRGGTTAEVYLPAALISLDAEPGRWRRRADQASWADAGLAAYPVEAAGAGVADLPFSALRFASGPEPPLDPETDEPEPPLGSDTEVHEPVPVMLGAPPAPAAPGAPAEPTEPEPGDGTPIFESVRSGYLHAFGQGQLGFSGQPAPGWPARPPSPWGDGGRYSVAGPEAGRPAAAVPPPRIPRPGEVHGVAADQETEPASAAESAEVTRSKLASFQRGSRRARAVARMNRSAKHPGQDG